MQWILASLVGLYLLIGSCLSECHFSGTQYTLTDATGHYYRVLECFNETWENVNQYAQTLVHPETGAKGYLMTINSYEEQSILSVRINSPSSVDVFIGGYDAVGDNSFLWTGADAGEYIYTNARGCMGYCNFQVGQPATLSASGPQGLRLRRNRWIAASSTEVIPWVWAYVEYGCCECKLNGGCNERTCKCACGENWVGPHCEVYIGPCANPYIPICIPAEPVCYKSAPTAAPTNAPTNAPEEPTCLVSVTPVLRDDYSWPVGASGRGGVYDIVVVNTGSYTAKRAYFDVVIPASAAITTWWMFSREVPTFIDLPSLSPGSSYSTGSFILEDSNSSSLTVLFSYNYAVC